MTSTKGRGEEGITKFLAIFLIVGDGVQKANLPFLYHMYRLFTFVWLLAVITPPFKLFLVICSSIMEAQEVR